MKSIKDVDSRLSYSSAEDLRLCEQRWYHRKVSKTKEDPDYESGDHFSIGSAFHKICEDNLHQKPKSISKDLKACTKDPDIQLKTEYYPLVAAMVNTYVKLHKKSGLKVVACEEKIEEKGFMVGYIDVILSDKDGTWYVGDLKTAKYFRIEDTPKLINNTQLSIYSPYAMDICKQYGLDPKKFGGAKYRVTLKPQLKRRSGESNSDYAKRLMGSCRAYDVTIPPERLNVDALIEHEIVWERAQDLISGEEEPRKNYSSCMAFFSPCPYFSQCHGGTTFTAAKEVLDVLEVVND